MFNEATFRAVLFLLSGYRFSMLFQCLYRRLETCFFKEQWSSGYGPGFPIQGLQAQNYLVAP